MRIRISTSLPLPPLKAWYLLPSSVETINDLKTQLVNDLLAFKGIKPASLAFEVDGFEVLGASRCEVLNEERDVLCVKLQENSAPPSKKRKKAQSEAPPPSTTLDTSSSSRKKRKLSPTPASAPPTKKSKSLPPPPIVQAPKPKKKKVKADPPPPPPPVVVAPPPPPSKAALKRPAPSDSSDSDSDSSSSSSSSSSSDSDSDDSSDSDSSSGPETSSSKLIPAGRPLLLPKSFTDKGKGKEANSTVIHLTPIIPDQPPVPPGQGLSSTHERNVRRRKKKAALKLLSGSTTTLPSPVTLSSSSPKEASSTAMPPPGSPSPFLSSQIVETSTSQPDVLIAFSANANRNKKRDFKKAMATAVGQKTTFFNSNVPIYSAVPPPQATPSRVSALQRGNSNSATSTPTGGGKRPYQHVLAPSERTSLPAGMFVTSVDVETEEWEAAQGWGVEVQQESAPKKKGGKGAKGGGQQESSGGGGGDRKGREENGADGSKEWSDYIRAEEENTSAAMKGEVVSKEVDWTTVDASFEGASPVTSFEQLKVGARVGWKELILNPSTFTPEISLLVGTVATIEGVENVTVKMEQRPLEFDAEEEEMQSTNQPGKEEDEIRVFGKEEVTKGEWRLL